MRFLSQIGSNGMELIEPYVSCVSTNLREDHEMVTRQRAVRLQIMLDENEVEAIENWRFKKRMPSRASAVREIIRRGLVADGFNLANGGHRSSDYGVISTPESTERPLRQGVGSNRNLPDQ